MDSCLAITDYLISQQYCSIFLEPVDPIRDEVPDYFKIIKNPQDLGTIRKRLLNKEYKSISDWKRDMNLIWTNCEKFNGRDSILGELSRFALMMFEKQCKKHLPYSPIEWVNRITSLYEKINVFLKDSPRSVSYKFKKLDIPREHSPEEIQKLSEAVSCLSTRSDVLQLVQLLGLFGINIEGKRDVVYVSLSELPDQAITALMSYVKERYKALRMEYPK